ncbi:MAG: hypothetical protein KAR08_03275 [Candidatus Heimdallarchaeota archaeon]|nr:hypothetical protein [Candidatus Heimdallarchaeota archaeon]
MTYFLGRKRKSSSLFVIILLTMVFFSYVLNSETTKANPLSIMYLGHGVLLPTNYTHGVKMQNAGVSLDIVAFKNNRTAFIDYEGNYTFYNTNSTQTLLIAAPFAYSLYEAEINVLVDKTKVNFTLVELFYDDFENFTSIDYYSYFSAIICNITFNENTTTNVFYEFEALRTSIGYDTTNIDYIVGTANSWYNSSSIDETVEFKVTGFQPRGYSGNCIKTRIDSGKSYLWKWENEPIEVEKVGIYYRHTTFSGLPLGLTLTLIIVVPIICTALIIYGIVKFVKKSKKK